MSYCVDIDCGGVTISADKVADCLAAINRLQAGQHYAWVDDPPEGGFPTLVKALDNWRYEAEEQADGSVELQYFAGEKLGDDEALYEAIAPFVSDGGRIDCRGEDDCLWRYCFSKGAVEMLSGRIEYGEPFGHIKDETLKQLLLDVYGGDAASLKALKDYLTDCPAGVE